MAGWMMKLAGEKGRSPERPSSEQYEPLSECDGKPPKGTEQGTVPSHCAMKCRADVPCWPTLSSDGEAGWSPVYLLGYTGKPAASPASHPQTRGPGTSKACNRLRSRSSPVLGVGQEQAQQTCAGRSQAAHSWRSSGKVMEGVAVKGRRNGRVVTERVWGWEFVCLCFLSRGRFGHVQLLL